MTPNSVLGAVAVMGVVYMTPGAADRPPPPLSSMYGAQEQEPPSVPVSPAPPRELLPPSKVVPAGCENLDSRLIQLTQVQDIDAETLAASLGLDYSSGLVLVVIELSGAQSPDPAIYQFVLEAEYANLLQARVPVQQLCPLANDPSVTRVRPPFSAAPSGN